MPLDQEGTLRAFSILVILAGKMPETPSENVMWILENSDKKYDHTSSLDVACLSPWLALNNKRQL
jgi:hypothetical protein